MQDPTQQDAKDLESLLDQLEWAAETDHEHLTIGDILSAVGTRSFAPMLLLVGVLIASPLSGIPGFPTVSAFIVVVVSLQMLLYRRHFWLPAWLLHRGVPRSSMSAAIRWLRPSARFVDRLIKPRLGVLVKGPATTIIALVCLFIATGMPLLELIPFSSSLAGVTLAAFGLALVSHDGLVALIAYVVGGSTVGLALFGLLA